MYKYAFDENDKNNVIPAALAASAIGGVSGLAASMLSKKQRKNKWRNALIGATAAPALFLAADKWGPDSVKEKLNDVSGNIYEGYSNYLANKLPTSVQGWVGSKNVAAQSGVANQKRELDRIQKAKASHEKTPKKGFTPMPTYNGLAYGDYYNTKQTLNSDLQDTSDISGAIAANTAALSKINDERSEADDQDEKSIGTNVATANQLTEKQTGLTSQIKQLQDNQSSEQSAAETAYNAAVKAVVRPEDTEAWKEYEKNISELKAGKQQAVLARLRNELESGNLKGRAYQDAMDVIDDLESIASRKVEAENNLSAAKNKVKTFGQQLEDLRVKYETRNAQLEGALDEKKRRKGTIQSKLYDRKGSAAYQNARKDYDTTELDALQKALKLYDPKASTLTGPFVQKLIDEGNTDAAEALSVLTPLEQEFSRKFSQGELSARQAAALDDARTAARPQAELAYKNDRRAWRSTSGARVNPTEEEVPSIDSRIDKALASKREGILRAVEEQFNKDKEEYIKQILAQPRENMRRIIHHAVDSKNKRIGELTAALDASMRADQAKLREELPQLGGMIQVLEKELKDRKATDFQDLKKMLDLEKAIGAANGEIEKYQGILDGLNEEREYSPLIKNLLKQYGDEYDAEKINPVEEKKLELKDTYTSNLGALKNTYDLVANERNSRYTAEQSDLEKQLASIADRLQTLKTEKENIEQNAKTRNEGFRGREQQAAVALEEAKAKEIQRIADIKRQLEALDARWAGDQANYEKSINAWHKQYGDDLQYNQQWDEKLNSLSSAEAKANNLLNYLREGEANKRNIRQNNLLAATGGSAGALILLSALNKLRNRRKQKISPEEYINYLEEEGLA